MASPTSSPVRIGIYGKDNAAPDLRGVGLWPVGYQGAVTHAGGTPVPIPQFQRGDSWKELLHGLDGIVFANWEGAAPAPGLPEEGLAKYCKQYQVPLLAIDAGLHVLNLAFQGTLYDDLSREQPEALQHRHPPERGLRHAINILPDTRLAQLYGEGEVVVNSEHRRGLQRLARGFRVCAQALDSVVEAIEPESGDWWVMGVQWHPASASASGLDIQLFRGVVDAALGKFQEQEKAAVHAA